MSPAGPVDALLDEYDRLAPDYDRRWASYIEATTRETLRRLDVERGERVLDVGCGTGVLLEGLSRGVPGAALVGVDVSFGMLRVARERLGGEAELVQAGAEALPFADASFDVVASVSALHFFADPLRALRGIARVLRPGGRLVLTDWCADFLGVRALDLWLRMVDAAHVRARRADECRRLVAEAGFEDVRVDRYKIDRFWGLMTVVARRPRTRSRNA